jgi:hypothetical protein
LARFDRAGVATDFREVLQEETKEIGRRRRMTAKQTVNAPTSSGPPSPSPSGRQSVIPDLAGIALSGGGVRSATFCLGVLQALQERGVLRMFDYLSTVSGGGFAGGWWSAWLSRPGAAAGAAGPRPLFPPQERIEPERETDYRTGAAPDIEHGGEIGAPLMDLLPSNPDPVHHLRLFSNYLTPRKGAFSADTWRAATVVSRNLLLTWLVLLPILVALLAIGQIYFLSTPASAHGFVCTPGDSSLSPNDRLRPAPACVLVKDQMNKLTGSADSVKAVVDRKPTEVRADRISYALAPVLVLLGWLLVTTFVWLLTGARDLPQLAGLVVGLAAASTLLHAVAERFIPPGASFHVTDHSAWVGIFSIGAILIVLLGWVIPLVLDERFLTGRGREDRREVRMNMVTRIHARILSMTVIIALVLAIGGFAPDLFDFLFGAGGKQGALLRAVAQTGGWLAVLTSIAGTVVTVWSAAPAGGGEEERTVPSQWRNALLAVTPVLVLVLVAVLIATGLRYGLAHLPAPGTAARTPFLAIVPGVLLLAGVAVAVRRLAVWNSPVAVHLDRVLWGLLLAIMGSLFAFLIYWLARPLEKLEPLGTSVLLVVLLAGFFAIFEYLTDESITPRLIRLAIVLIAAVAALVAGLVAARWSPLGWGRLMPGAAPRLPAALIVGFTIGLVLARCSVTWSVDLANGRDVLRSRMAVLRNLRHPGRAAWGSLALGLVLGPLVGWWLAERPIPFDALIASAPTDDPTRRFTTFCVAALVFASAFVVADLALSRTDSGRALWLQVLAVGLLGPTLMQQYLNPLAPSVLFVNADLAFAGIAIAIVMGLGWLVDPNAIGLHTFYRARLVRAYLGASNPGRTGNVTEAARGDDLPLSTLGNCRRGGPYHLINTTLNLVGGRDLTTAQRSAASFTLSTLYCGSLRTGYRPTYDYMGDQMSLGTALAISGAAASPNMGSKTPSAALAMWLAFLNVRLGFWAPTPHRPRWRSPQPRLWPFYFMAESLSQTNDLGSYCYLTDGGHFDNTGLYSLVERGCRYIVVADCGADPGPCFGDMGDAVRRCRIDFDAEIELEVAPFKRNKKGFATSHYVAGTIVYSRAHAERLGWGPDAALADRTGYILWLKPSRRPGDPVDVQQYGLENSAFPQQTTADQWFSESQFESYRRLGLETARDMLGSEPYYAPGSPIDAPGVFQAIYGRYHG